MLKFFVALFDLLFGAREPLPDKFFEPPARDAAFQSEAAGEWAPLPRMLLVLKARPPYLKWIRQQGLEPDRPEWQGVMIPTVYWEREEADDFVAAYWPNLFAQMLQSCAFDPARWPEPRTRGMFHEWFDVEVCTTVIDLGGDPDRNRY